MEAEEKNVMQPLLVDMDNLKWKVDGIEKMLETLIDIYIDVFYEVKHDYLEELKTIKKERGKVFNYIEEFDRYFE